MPPGPPDRPAVPPDPLGIRAATAFVMSRARHVRLDAEAAARLVQQWTGEGVRPPGWYPKYHFFDGTHRSANWLLALDSVNFCFWAEDPSQRWEIEYQGERLDGYWALAASMTRAVEEGTRLWDARVLAEMEQGDVYRIFRGSGVIPLIGDRLNNLRETGAVLLDRYNGQFLRTIGAAGGSAAALAKAIVRDFPSFRDTAAYDGREIPFYKRAQLLVSDLWGAFGGRGLGEFRDMEALTAFADYKLPQLLREHRVLVYSEDLAERVDRRELLAAGSPEEVEIRAATVQACDLLRDLLAERGVPLMAFQVDWLLWNQSQGLVLQHPYHLTRTIYY